MKLANNSTSAYSALMTATTTIGRAVAIMTGLKHANNLADLYDWLAIASDFKGDDDRPDFLSFTGYDLSSLPTFGRPIEDHEEGRGAVWSYDETCMIVGDAGLDELEFISREEDDEEPIEEWIDDEGRLCVAVSDEARALYVNALAEECANAEADVRYWERSR